MRVTGVSPKPGSVAQAQYKPTLFPGAAPGSPRLFGQAHNPCPWRVCLQALEHHTGCRPERRLCQGTKPQSRADTAGWASPSFGGNIPWRSVLPICTQPFLDKPGQVMPSSSALETKASLCVPRASMDTSSCGLSRRSMLRSSLPKPRIPQMCGGPSVSWTYLALKTSRTIGMKISTLHYF